MIAALQPETRGVSRSIVLLAAVLGATCTSPPDERMGSAARTVSDTCVRCSRYDFLCCNVPSDGIYYMTTFGGARDARYDGQTMACGGLADGRTYYATSWVRWDGGCGTRIRVENPATGACVIAEIADAGPNANVEITAGRPILDASPLLCEALFGQELCSWRTARVHVTEVDEDTPLGPQGCTGGGGAGAREDRNDDGARTDDGNGSGGQDDGARSGEGGAPDDWRCGERAWGAFYGDGDCDCGCSATADDAPSDCPDGRCDYCWDEDPDWGACSDGSSWTDDSSNGDGANDDGWGASDGCDSYDWTWNCVDGDGRCDEGDGCCGWDADCRGNGGGAYDPCVDYDWTWYCVDGDGYCDEGDGCCPYDEDDHTGICDDAQWV